MLTSYRAVLLHDGRVAVQVHAADRHSGVSEDGVSTRYSLDCGKTWHERVHSSIEDDFGRPALFEVVLGPLLEVADLLIGVSARDNAGNITMQLPVDAGAFLAPPNTEQVLDYFGTAGPNSNPIFAPAAVMRRAAWVATAESDVAHLLASGPLRDLNAMERFELRRLGELRAIPNAFERAGVDASGFRQLDVPIVHAPTEDGVDRTVLRLGTC